MTPSQMTSLSQNDSLVGLSLVCWCNQGFLCRYVYPTKKALAASHFVLDMFWTCDLSIYLYIFFMHVDALLWFYYVSLFIMLWNANAYVMYYYTMCVFLDMIMHCFMVVCFLYVVMDVPIQNIISHLICDTIEVSGNMCECDGFKCSNHLFSVQEFSKEAGITYLIVIVQLRNKQLGV